MVLRVGYVREHFASPLLKYADEDKGLTFTLVECPSGSGQLISRLASDEIDIAIGLTDPFIAGLFCDRAQYKLVGTYVNSPLNWAVITGRYSGYREIADLKDTTMGISRPNSGSQTMAFVMALQQGWNRDSLKFAVNNDILGLVRSVNDGSTSAFLWEWFTTKPWLDRGDVRFIGSIPTPWPSWVIAAHPSPTRAPNASLEHFLYQLSQHIRLFITESTEEDRVAFIKLCFGYSEADIRSWLATVRYPQSCNQISQDVLAQTANWLNDAGVVSIPVPGFGIQDFVNQEVCSITSGILPDVPTGITAE